MKMRAFCLTAATALLFCATATAQHLWWDLQGQNDATCLYGEITVLATHPAICYGQPTTGEKGKKLEPISDIPLDKKLVVALKKVSRTKATESK